MLQKKLMQQFMETDARLEARLLNELARLNREIHNLQGERAALERLITRARRENVAVREVTRINSAARVLIEQAVLEKLRKANGRSLSVEELRLAARSVEIGIKDPTFRSHLHRLKNRGLIESAGYGRWRIPVPA